MSNLAIEGQHDGDYNGPARGLPGGQGHDKPLVPVGTYTRPEPAFDAGMIHVCTGTPAKKAGGTQGVYTQDTMPAWLA